LHLNNYDAFRNVLPSKIFEYGASGKPIWAGVAGFSEEFILQEISNATVFAPCDVEESIRSFKKLAFIYEPRIDFIKKYARSNIMLSMAEDILLLL
jgi:hypothetical protein